MGIDHIKGLVNASIENMKKKDGELLEKKIVDLVGMELCLFNFTFNFSFTPFSICFNISFDI